MQVKKFEAASIIEALQKVKIELGPDAIILSTQEMKRSLGSPQKYTVVAAVSEGQLRKKEMAEKKMGSFFDSKVKNQSAHKQKQFIESVYKGVEKKAIDKNRVFTQTPYIDIIDSQDSSKPQNSVATPEPVSSAKRVKQAVRDAFRTSLDSELLTENQRNALTRSAPPLTSMTAPTVIKTPELPEPVSKMIQRLKACGVAPELCQQLLSMIQQEIGPHLGRKAIVDSWFAKWILNHTSVCEKDSQHAIEVFVGPHGSGKTTSLLKLASHYIVQEQKDVAIITTDLQKVGAVEQLRVFSRILNVPLYVVRNVRDLNQKIQELSSCDKILIDTQGMNLGNMEELEVMQSLSQVDSIRNKRIHLVVSALAKSSDLGALLKRFRVSQFNDLIVTNIDQTTQHGILINIQDKVQSPFHSFGIGSDIVDGFEFASKERVLDLVFRLTKTIGDKSNDSRI